MKKKFFTIYTSWIALLIIIMTLGCSGAEPEGGTNDSIPGETAMVENAVASESQEEASKTGEDVAVECENEDNASETKEVTEATEATPEESGAADEIQTIEIVAPELDSISYDASLKEILEEDFEICPQQFDEAVVRVTERIIESVLEESNLSREEAEHFRNSFTILSFYELMNNDFTSAFFADALGLSFQEIKDVHTAANLSYLNKAWEADLISGEVAQAALVYSSVDSIATTAEVYGLSTDEYTNRIMSGNPLPQLDNDTLRERYGTILVPAYQNVVEQARANGSITFPQYKIMYPGSICDPQLLNQNQDQYIQNQIGLIINDNPLENCWPIFEFGENTDQAGGNGTNGTIPIPTSIINGTFSQGTVTIIEPQSPPPPPPHQSHPTLTTGSVYKNSGPLSCDGDGSYYFRLSFVETDALDGIYLWLPPDRSIKKISGNFNAGDDLVYCGKVLDVVIKAASNTEYNCNSKQPYPDDLCNRLVN